MNQKFMVFLLLKNGELAAITIPESVTPTRLQEPNALNLVEILVKKAHRKNDYAVVLFSPKTHLTSAP